MTEKVNTPKGSEEGWVPMWMGQTQLEALQLLQRREYITVALH
jgi:hypothetical protein